MPWVGVAFWVNGQVMVGLVVSTIKTVKEHDPMLPALSVAEHNTVYGDVEGVIWKIDPLTGEHVGPEAIPEPSLVLIE
jgi:hypothetical protein